jgi:hypothetical protein
MNRDARVPRLILTLAIAGFVGGLDSSRASEASNGPPTSYVATNGVDNPTCGSKALPCRTINAAMARARAGNAIAVAPGSYGPDEHSSNETECLVCIDKSLYIYSTHGAAVTSISTGGPHLVSIQADHVAFGSADHGFTLVGSGGGALEVSHSSEVYITGNTVRNAGVGIFVSADRGPVFVHRNIVVDNSNGGILVTTPQGGNGSVWVSNNIVTGTGNAGLLIDGFATHHVIDNLVSGNVAGMELRNNSLVKGNVFSNNLLGIFVSDTGEAYNAGVLGGGVQIYQNVVTDNTGVGIEFKAGTTAAPNHQIHYNDIYGNGTGQVFYIYHDSNAPLNCGVLNESTGFVDARDNFWGLPSGPGPDPADLGGPGTCDKSGTTAVIPYAKGPF